ncbi:G surface protein, allelic form 168 [Eurosta solidaginis]|uniref:G surface protein, allelic form 168 n=1 Tax=Eurosta solidaginis TaxID=178769 RepID=UPI0035316421
MAVRNNGTVSRGCFLNTTECKQETCVTCDTDNCNNNNICKTCDSSNDPKCAQTEATDVKNAICAKADTKCMISVLESKTERGCVTDDFAKKCTDDKKCKMCGGSICNVGVFPTDRLYCHQCKETDSNCSSATTTNAALSCLLHVENDKCYMYGSDAEHITRGCTSDPGPTNKCAKLDDTNCRACDTNNCNDWSYKIDQPLRCIACISKDNAKCAWGQSASNAKSCEKKIVYSAEPKCYTRTDENEVVTRGCFYDLDEASQTACADGKNCTVCTNSNGCNNVDAKNFTCIQCRSDNYAGCLNESKGMDGGKCRHVVESDADAKCFAGVWNDGLVIRGCFIDLEVRDQYTCNNTNNELCYVCDGANCNTKNLNNAARNLILTNGLLVFGLFILWRLK